MGPWVPGIVPLALLHMFSYGLFWQTVPGAGVERLKIRLDNVYFYGVCDGGCWNFVEQDLDRTEKQIMKKRRL